MIILDAGVCLDIRSNENYDSWNNSGGICAFDTGNSAPVSEMAYVIGIVGFVHATRATPCYATIRQNSTNNTK